MPPGNVSLNAWKEIEIRFEYDPDLNREVGRIPTSVFLTTSANVGSLHPKQKRCPLYVN